MVNVRSKGGGASSSLFSGGRQASALRFCMEAKPPTFKVAHQGTRGGSANRVVSGLQARHQQALRLSSQVQGGVEGEAVLQPDSAALSRHWGSGNPASGHSRRPLAHLLSGSKEGHRQGQGLHRSSQGEPTHRLQALQDGGPSHCFSAGQERRLWGDSRHEGLLHALAPKEARPPSHEVHVGGSQVSMLGNAIRSGSCSSTGNKAVPAGSSQTSIHGSSSNRVYRRLLTSVSFLQRGSATGSAYGGSDSPARLRHPSRQVSVGAKPVQGLLGHSGQHKISTLLHQNESGGLTTRLLACMLGKLNALRGAVVSAQLHLWPLHHLLRQSLAVSSWEGKAVLDDSSIEELQWWQQQMHQWSGQTIIPKRSQMVLTTDASHLGWGGWWRRFGQKGRSLDEARGFWLAKEAKMSSNGRELKAVLLSVKAAISHLAGHIVLVETDNKVTMAYINHMGGRSRFLHSMARELWLLCHQHSILLQAVHRPGKVNLRADRLSRWTVDHTDVRLPPSAFQRVEQLWGPHTVDLFASRHNHLLPRYVSWKPDPEAIAVDAFMFQLRDENPYCFPPPACIPRLLQEVVHQQATVTLIAPGWQAPWLPDLRRLLLAPPLPLKELPELPVQDQASRFLHWNLHCFRISGSHSRLAHSRRAMQTQL